MRIWIGPGGQGAWTVDARRWEELYLSADWDTKFINDPERARREWDALK